MVIFVNQACVNEATESVILVDQLSLDSVTTMLQMSYSRSAASCCMPEYWNI